MSELNDENAGSSRVVVKVMPIGRSFVNGISSAYDSINFDERMSTFMTEAEFTSIIDDFNETLVSFWPCGACYFFGICCSPCTFGLSLLLPSTCVSEAESHGRDFLRDISLKAKFYDQNIKFDLHRSTCTSYVEISFPQSLLNTYVAPSNQK